MFELIVKFLIPFLIGSSIFFAAVVAPNSFKNLDEKNARKFIRSIFPKLYLWSAVLSFLIFVSLLPINHFFAFIMFVVFIGYIFSREFLMKLINQAADNKTDQKKFKKLHTFSVIIFVSQIFIMFALYLLI